MFTLTKIVLYYIILSKLIKLKLWRFYASNRRLEVFNIFSNIRNVANAISINNKQIDRGLI